MVKMDHLPIQAAIETLDLPMVKHERKIGELNKHDDRCYFVGFRVFCLDVFGSYQKHDKIPQKKYHVFALFDPPQMGTPQP